ncbi:MAG: phenylalanyl-tRNA synthetase beta chain [Candidatus Parcubacteria bacterium]|jgi:phenylalanyl-tRNA synthetase beta chain|nr:phenylalanyl-tRNA synthetase beta chain [Candidatus Parcubacteria bacterium]
MKVSRNWLQKFFEAPLPEAEALAGALTFHSSEVEEIQGDVLDVKVLPDRACYMLSHRGVASEVAAALDIPMKDDPLAAPLPAWPTTEQLELTIRIDGCLRHLGALVRGVRVGPSPDWLRKALESVGQRSVNNIVDATNYVTLNMGQPLHAFDASKIGSDRGILRVGVRDTLEGESIQVLSGETYVLPEGTLVICEGVDGKLLDIAGIKGGMASAITEQTTDLFISVANFDGTSIRRAAQALKLFTDASARFQNRPSSELVAYGMRDVLSLIREVAGGEVVGVTDQYPAPESMPRLSVSLERINKVLGTAYAASDVTGALDRLGIPHTLEGETFHVTPPFVRCDLRIPEDIAEEAGRVLGYEHVPPTLLPASDGAPDQLRQRGIERIKDLLLERGYVEILTPSFAKAGEIELANPLQMDRPYLRPDLAGNMRDALRRARYEAPRTLGPEPSLKLFEIGTVFASAGESLSLALGYESLTGKTSKLILDDDIDALMETMPDAGFAKSVLHDGTVAELSLADVNLGSLGEGYEPKRLILGPYRPYSIYPFALRDIAVWTTEVTEESEVALLIQKEAGELLLRMDLFDRFDKDGRTSYAFRLVFEAPDRTLSDADLDPVMERITAALNSRDGWEVR